MRMLINKRKYDSSVIIEHALKGQISLFLNLCSNYSTGQQSKIAKRYILVGYEILWMSWHYKSDI